MSSGRSQNAKYRISKSEVNKLTTRNNLYLTRTILLLLCILLFSIISCFDIVERTYWNDKNYHVSDDPGSHCKTLYRNLEDGNAIGRISCITQLGYNELYIIVESEDHTKQTPKHYWILNKTDDNNSYNAEEIVNGPFDSAQFEAMKSQLGIKNISFSKKWR